MFFLLLLVFLGGCSGLQKSEEDNLRRQNATGEPIRRQSGEQLYTLTPPTPHQRDKYPWEEAYIGKNTRINKEYFRCRGSSAHPPHEAHFDCGGSQTHTLPLREGQEFIYPILIDLLNHIQTKTGHKVVITCGHRCPSHNKYADPSPATQHSKHLIGAEVDFYVEGYENQPEKIVQLLFDYYRASHPGDKAYTEFLRLDKPGLTTPPWYNKEIFIKLLSKTEGRDFDNAHSYPYLSLQVRYDQQLNEKVVVDWNKAINCYRRY